MQEKNLLNTYLMFFICFAINFSKLNAQTYVSGGIYANTTWTLANSPYIVTSKLVLFPNFSLTIQPGVVVKFNDSVEFEVRGVLSAIGTITDSIKFISNSTAPNLQSWKGVFTKGNLGGTTFLKYAIIEHSDNGINVTGSGPPVHFVRCRFSNNYEGLSGFNAALISDVDSCFFSNNFIAISNFQARVKNSFFINNNFGLNIPTTVNVIKSNFCNNQTAIFGQNITADSCIIKNNGIGVRSDLGLFVLSNNVIIANDTGIIFNCQSLTLVNNKICNNVINFKTEIAANILIADQCWCETNSNVIGQSIYDGYDNINLGLVIFSPVLNCDSTAILPYSNCNQTISSNMKQSLEIEPHVSIYPNPNTGSFMMDLSNPFLYSKSCYLEIFDMFGSRIYYKNLTQLRVTRIEIPEAKKGIYIARITADGLSVINKIIIQ
jgi:hypothetical protein